MANPQWKRCAAPRRQYWLSVITMSWEKKGGWRWSELDCPAYSRLVGVSTGSVACRLDKQAPDSYHLQGPRFHHRATVICIRCWPEPQPWWDNANVFIVPSTAFYSLPLWPRPDVQPARLNHLSYALFNLTWTLPLSHHFCNLNISIFMFVCVVPLTIIIVSHKCSFMYNYKPRIAVSNLCFQVLRLKSP